MTVQEKIYHLKRRIDSSLNGIIRTDYVLLEIPDYPNPGDMLIFNGEKEFLNTIERRCLERSTMASFCARLPRLRDDTLIIFRGGGYFGDLWKEGPDFQRKVLEQYPKNPILIMPQSACFTNRDNIDDYRNRYGTRKNIVICLRDQMSYDLVRSKIRVDCMLVPDMAFYANIGLWTADKTLRNLLILRDDKELKSNLLFEECRRAGNFDISDWPSRKGYPDIQRKAEELCDKCKKFLIDPVSYDHFIEHDYYLFQMKSALEFLGPYNTVYTTRLHGGILSILMGKHTVFLDNSYGKISSLYRTWLSDCENVRLLE